MTRTHHTHGPQLNRHLSLFRRHRQLRKLLAQLQDQLQQQFEFQELQQHERPLHEPASVPLLEQLASLDEVPRARATDSSSSQASDRAALPRHARTVV